MLSTRIFEVCRRPFQNLASISINALIHRLNVSDVFGYNYTSLISLNYRINTLQVNSNVGNFECDVSRKEVKVIPSLLNVSPLHGSETHERHPVGISSQASSDVLQRIFGRSTQNQQSGL